MNLKEFKDFCTSFEGVSEQYPFDNEDIIGFRVMGEIFALTNEKEFDHITIKCDPIKAATLRNLYPEIEPGLYMDNMKEWNSIDTDGYLSDVLIKEWIKDSYDLVVEELPRKEQKKLEKIVEKKKKKEKKEKNEE